MNAQALRTLDDDPLYTKREVAAMLKVSVRTVERLIANDAMLATMVGSNVRIAQSEYLAYRDRNTRPRTIT